MDEAHFLMFIIGIHLTRLGSISALMITRLEVPRTVETNSSAVLLDCDYWIEEWERENGFVLKWYIDHVHLVYQWIPPRPPQALGKLKGRIDPFYEASPNPWEKHRALKIHRPDPKLSGTYTCTTTTFDGEDSDSAALLVWAPSSRIDLHFWRPTEFLINVTCSAYAVSPKPEFHLYVIDHRRKKKSIIKRERRDVNATQESFFHSQVWGLLIYSETKRGAVIGCTVTIPHTGYRETRERAFNPNIPVIATTTTSTTTTETSLPEEEAIRSANISNSAISLTDRSPYKIIILLFVYWWRETSKVVSLMPDG